MSEYLVLGPPGTGKTTWLKQQIINAVEKRGENAILALSFTKAAAVELAGRNLPIPPEHVSTLHACCYRAMGRPTIAETKLGEWNAQCPVSYRLSGGKVDIDEPLEYEAEDAGDDLLQRMNLLRERLIPFELWPPEVAAFSGVWQDWLNDNEYTDFTGMLEWAYRHTETAPDAPSVIMLDEAQDCSALQWALIRKWGRHCDDLICVGDDDQILYAWAGASVESMFNPQAKQIILKHSWRVPRAIHAAAVQWIGQAHTRLPKEYLARDAEGSIRHMRQATWKSPERLLDVIAEAESQRQTTMILGACSYMLNPTLAMLRGRGIPYHNPYRRKRGDWNPLAHGRGVTMAERLLAYLRPQEVIWGREARMWTWREVQQFATPLHADGALRRGAKKTLDAWPKETLDHEAELERLRTEIFEEQALGSIFDGDARWYKQHVLATKAKLLDYPLAILERRGIRGLQERPNVVIGTIHSVKGGEADQVVLFPDLSFAGWREWAAGGAARDGVLRQFYVGMTRARESLQVCAAVKDAPRVELGI